MIEKLAKIACVKDFVFKGDESQEFISTNCAVLNILFGGNIDRGIPKGKISMIAADSALGKSQISLNVAKRAQMQGMNVVIFDSEKAINDLTIKNFNLDNEKLLVIQSTSLEHVSNMIMNIENEISKEKHNYIFIIDSWNVLVSSKTIEDVTSGKDVVDMTTTKKKNTLAKLLLNSGVTTFIVNQVYSSMSPFQPLDEIPGGKGVYFASSSIVQSISKAKHKEKNGDVSGVLITAISRKGRFSKENSKLQYKIDYNGGINPYYGLLDLAVDSGIIEKLTMGRYCFKEEPNTTFKEEEFYKDELMLKMIIQNQDFKKFIELHYTYYNEDENSVNAVSDF